MYKLILISFLILLSFPVLAKTDLVDVEWRKIELEKILSDRVKNLLSDESFSGVSNVDVQITLDKEKFASEIRRKDQSIDLNANVPKTDLAITPIAKFDLESEVVHFKEQMKVVEDQPIDIYKYFKAINVAIYFDQKLSAEKQNLVLEFVNKNFPSYSGVKINYSGKASMAIPEEVKAVEEAEFWNSRRQDYVLYFVISVLGMIALIRASQTVYKGLMSLSESFAKTQESALAGIGGSASIDLSQEESTPKDDLPKSSGSTNTRISFDKHEGIKKFKALLEQYTKEAVSLIKQWMHERSFDSNSALYMVLRSLDVNELQNLFKQVPPKERMKLKKILNLSANEIDSDRGDAFLQDQISTLLLYRDKIKDEILKELIADSDDKKLMEAIMTNRFAGAYLLSMLPPYRSSRISDSLDEDVFIEVMTSSLEEEVPVDVMNFLKTNLNQEETKVQRLPVFLENIEDFLTNASPQREETIFKLASEFFDKDEMSDLLLKFFPVFLIKKLPSTGLHRVVTKLNNQERIRFLANLEENARTEVLNQVGEVGSRAREVYEVDLEKVIGNEIAMTKIKNDSEKIWYTFTLATRKIIQNDETLRRSASEIASSWIDDNSSFNNTDKPVAA